MHDIRALDDEMNFDIRTNEIIHLGISVDADSRHWASKRSVFESVSKDPRKNWRCGFLSRTFPPREGFTSGLPPFLPLPSSHRTSVVGAWKHS